MECLIPKAPSHSCTVQEEKDWRYPLGDAIACKPIASGMLDLNKNHRFCVESKEVTDFMQNTWRDVAWPEGGGSNTCIV